MLKERGFYTIELADGGKVNLRFCTWTFKRFCETNGDLTIIQFQQLMGNGLSFSQFMSLMLYAAEYSFVKDGKQSPYRDIDASDWIDELGGLAGDKFIDMMMVVSKSFGGNQNHQQKKVHRRKQRINMGGAV